MTIMQQEKTKIICKNPSKTPTSTPPKRAPKNDPLAGLMEN